MTEREKLDRVLAWLGYWRDHMPDEAVKQLQDIVADQPDTPRLYGWGENVPPEFQVKP